MFWALLLFWNVGSVSADYFVTSANTLTFPSATVVVRLPACVEDLDAVPKQQGRTGPCGEGSLQCPVQDTVGPVRVSVRAAALSTITPVAPPGYFLEGFDTTFPSLESGQVVQDQRLGIVAWSFTAPASSMNGSIARAEARMFRGLPEARTSTALCTMEVIWTIMNNILGPVALPSAPIEALPAALPAGPSLAPAGLPQAARLPAQAPSVA